MEELKYAKDQGRGWETYVGKSFPDCVALPPSAEGFHYFDPMMQEAIYAESMYTLHEGFISNPEMIFVILKQRIDCCAATKARRSFDPDPQFILSRTIHLGIPDLTHPKQWLQLYRAIAYGKTCGVRVVITRIAG